MSSKMSKSQQAMVDQMKAGAVMYVREQLRPQVAMHSKEGWFMRKVSQKSFEAMVAKGVIRRDVEVRRDVWSYVAVE